MKPIAAVVQAFLILRGKSVELLTWNAGGGYPLPEFLGGAWEDDGPGQWTDVYADVEKSIAVCLYGISGCDMPNGFSERYGGNSSFAEKYPKAYKELLHCKKHKPFGTLPTTWGDLKAEDLIENIGEIAPGNKMPDWAVESCTLDNLVGHLVCAKGNKPKETKCEGFALTKEGCFKARDTLPVFGKPFFELYKKLASPKVPPEFWTKWVLGLENQNGWEEKGCTKGKPPKISPGQFIKNQRQPNQTEQHKKEVVGPNEISYQRWSEIGLWDVLLMRLTHFSLDLLQKEPGRVKLEGELEGITAPSKPVMEKEVQKTVTNLVTTAAEGKDALFFQEKNYIVLSESEKSITTWRTNTADQDTAIYVPSGSAWKIDDPASKIAEDKWKIILAELKNGEHFKNYMVMATKKKELTKDKTELGEELKSHKAKTLCTRMARWFQKKFVNEPVNKMKKHETHHEKLNNIEHKIKVNDEAQKAVEKQIEDFFKKHEECTKWNEKIQNKYCENLFAKGAVYAEPKLSAVAVIGNPAEGMHLLLSIHSDSDGYFCVTFLHLAMKLFRSLKGDIAGLDSMFIGMDANLQIDESKGHNYDTLKESRPEGIAIVDPDQKTVFKCRSALQTQISKAGKKDTVKKDFIFAHTPHNNQDKTGHVKNSASNDGLTYKTIKTEQYFPTKEWPVDHFMVTASFPPKHTVEQPVTFNTFDETAKEKENTLKAEEVKSEPAVTVDNSDHESKPEAAVKMPEGDAANFQPANADGHVPKTSEKKNDDFGFKKWSGTASKTKAKHAARKILRKILRGVFAKS